MKKIKRKLLYVLILLAILIWGINLYFHFSQKQKIYIPGSIETTTTTIQENITIIISKRCDLDSDCSWEVTNCCSETAGAYWQCINKNESVIKCIGNILCPQFISPKPTAACECKEGECVG